MNLEFAKESIIEIRRQNDENHLINISDHSVFYSSEEPFKATVICTCNHKKQELTAEPYGNSKRYTITASNYSSYMCPYCKTFYNKEFCLDIKSIAKNTWGNKPVKVEKVDTYVTIEKHPDNDCGIVIKLIDVNLKIIKKEDNYDVDYEYLVKSCAEIIPGVISKAYKVNKTKLTECDSFDAFNINSETVNSDYIRKFYFENAINPIEFLKNNEEFAKKSGILDAYKYNNIIRSINCFFLNYKVWRKAHSFRCGMDSVMCIRVLTTYA